MPTQYSQDALGYEVGWSREASEWRRWPEALYDNCTVYNKLAAGNRLSIS